MTPMVHIWEQDFFLYEPAKLGNGHMCMPTRWFFREEIIHSWKVPHFYANACHIEPITSDEGNGGYIVHKYNTFIIDAEQLTLALPKLIATFEIDSMPDPRHILGLLIKSVCLTSIYM